MKKHMPFESDDTLVIGYNDGESKNTKQITVSTLPENIQFEIKIYDKLRQDLFDSYHVMNKNDLAFKAQQMTVQQMISAHFQAESSEEESKDK